MIDQEMIKEFVDEVEEHIRSFENAGLALEKKPDNSSLVNDLFRAAHSIKGAAGYMGFSKITELSHKMENVIDQVREKKLSPTKELMDVLFKCIDKIRKLIGEIETTGAEKSKIDNLMGIIAGILEENNFCPDSQDGQLSSDSLSPDSPSSTDADRELDEIFVQQSSEYMTQLLQLLGDLAANVDPRATVSQMMSVVIDFVQLTSYIKEKRIERCLEEFAEHLRQFHESDTVVLDEWKSVVSRDLQGILDKLPGNIAIEEKLLNHLRDTSDSNDKVPEKDEGLFAFPLDEDEKSLLEHFEETGDGSSRQGSGDEAASGVLDDSLIEEALKDGNIEEEVFNEKVEDAPSLESTTSTNSQDKETRITEAEQPIIIDEDAVVHSIEENFTEKHFVSDEATEGDKQQIITEEYDEELFEIFLDSFRDNLDRLNKIREALESGKASTPIIEKAIGHIDKMLSSANYMDYEIVVRLLEKWRRGLSELLTSSEKDPVEKYIKLYVEYTNKLCEIIPALKDKLDEKIEEIEEEIDLCEVSSASAELEVKIDTMFDLIESEQADVELKEQSQEIPLDVSGFQSDETHAASHGDTVSTDAEATNETEVSLTDLVSKQTLRVDAQKVDNLLNQVGELVVTRAGFSQTTELFRELIRQFTEDNKLDKQDLKLLRNISFRLTESSVSLGRVANELQEAVMKIRMLPVHHLFQRFPRLVRNQSESLDKKVRLKIRGSDTELDKRVLEQMADPLVHLLRNAIAHGIESPETRKKLGKPEEGTITLSAYHEGNHVILEVADDGRGIDTDRLRKVLIEKQFVTSKDLERLSDKEIINSIFLPGVSTSKTVDETSGRGVGMDIVKENVEQLNGSIEVKSQKGEGTKFIIKIPLTVAIIQALLVEVSGQIFTIPLTSVLEITRVFKEEIETIEGFEVIHLRDTTIPLLRLEEIFNLSGSRADQSRTFVVIVTVGNMEIGLIVHSLLGEQEVVIKPLTESLKENKGFSGATILGDGSISLIIDVAELADLVRARNMNSTTQLSIVA